MLPDDIEDALGLIREPWLRGAFSGSWNRPRTSPSRSCAFPRGERLWAMRQMAEKRAPMREVEGLISTTAGTGGGRGYSRPTWAPMPLLRRMARGEGLEEFLSGHPVMTDYCRNTERFSPLSQPAFQPRGPGRGASRSRPSRTLHPKLPCRHHPGDDPSALCPGLLEPGRAREPLAGAAS